MMAREGSRGDKGFEPDGFPVGAFAGNAPCPAGVAEFCNLRFLIEQQLQVIDELDRRGVDGRAAHDLLRRLMRQDEDLRRPTSAPGPRRLA